jgi:hypothetical protein
MATEVLNTEACGEGLFSSQAQNATERLPIVISLWELPISPPALDIGQVRNTAFSEL